MKNASRAGRARVRRALRLCSLVAEAHHLLEQKETVALESLDFVVCAIGAHLDQSA